MFILARSAELPDTDDMLALILWGGVLLVSVAVLLLFAGWARKKMREDDSKSAGAILTLQDIREMRDRGDISLEEYDHLRAMILAGVQKQMNQSGSPPGGSQS